MPSANSQCAIENLLGLSAGFPSKENGPNAHAGSRLNPRQTDAGAAAGVHAALQAPSGQPHSQQGPPQPLAAAVAGLTAAAVAGTTPRAVPMRSNGGSYHAYGYTQGFAYAQPTPSGCQPYSPTSAGEVASAMAHPIPAGSVGWSHYAAAPQYPVGHATVLPGSSSNMGLEPQPAANQGAPAAEATPRKGREVVPWRPSEDSAILQGVGEHGCKWSLLAQQLVGRSENAVRNRWHRLENAERTRRETLEKGLLVQGYRCRKCGHFKKGHMCQGLENAGGVSGAGGAAGWTSGLTGAAGAKRGRHEMALPQAHPTYNYGPPPYQMMQLGAAPAPTMMRHPVSAQTQPVYYADAPPQGYTQQQHYTQQLQSPQQAYPQAHAQLQQQHYLTCASPSSSYMHQLPPTHAQPVYYDQYGRRIPAAATTGHEQRQQLMDLQAGGGHFPRGAPPQIYTGDDVVIGYPLGLTSSPSGAPPSPGLSDGVMEAFFLQG